MKKSEIKVVNETELKETHAGICLQLRPILTEKKIDYNHGYEVSNFFSVIKDELRKQEQKKCDKSAPNKRARQLRQLLIDRLEHKLQDFKDNYLDRYVEYHHKLMHEELSAMLKGLEKTKAEKKDVGSNYDYYVKVATKRVEAHKAKMGRRSTNELAWLKDADKNYQDKFDRLIAKLVEHELSTDGFNLQTVNGGNGYEFGFLIEDNTQELEARFIYAAAESKLVIPHFRFIITRRGK